ncbi:hypothetical protein [Halobellus captivus]|uniref:hypothetical protein n=1 Tax=Halobellus captivus TaxID=2592614 RepID=UPI00119F207E|nr:hypothetical protein [Halobellus captivus]
MLSLSGCTQVTIGEDGITWGTAESTPTSTATEGGPTESPADVATEDDDEIDLSEFEDGSFSGGTPSISEGVRDGVEISVTPAGVDNEIRLLRETVQFEYSADLVARDDLVAELAEEEDNDSMVVQAEVVEIDDQVNEEPQVIQAELIPVDEEDDDEEDDDE